MIITVTTLVVALVIAGAISVPAKVTYTGDPADQDRGSVVLDYLGADGESGTINTCGHGGQAVERFEEVDLDNKPLVEGVACTAIPAAQAPGGQWRVVISWRTPEGQETYVDVFHATA